MPTSQTNYFEKAETSQDAAQGTHSLIESRNDAYSRHGSTTYLYRSLMDDGCFARCHPVTVPSRNSHSYYTGSYTRALLRLGNGTPLWDPIGNIARPQPHVKSSLMIGDVGFFDLDGDFSYLFNIFLPKTDPGQGLDCPDDFEPLFPPPRPSELITKPKHFAPRTTLVSPGVDVSCASTEPLDITFTIRAREGGILILPDGASREDLTDIGTARIREYVLKYIRDWYISVNPEIDLEVTRPNGSLCVITGHDKATSWAASQAGPYNPTGKPRTVQYSSLTDRWTQCIDVASQSSQVISEYDIDHCAVFVRTMRFALSPQNWVQNLLQNEPTEIYTFYYIPTVPVLGARAYIQTILDRIFKKVKEPASSECTEHAFHPSIVVLRYLLAASPLSDVATIEDSLWNSVASETDGSLSLTTRALINLLESHQILEKNGRAPSQALVYLSAYHNLSSGHVTLVPLLTSSDKPLPGPRKTFFNTSGGLKAESQRRGERRKLVSKLSKVFPGPRLPVFFHRADPNLPH